LEVQPEPFERKVGDERLWFLIRRGGEARESTFGQVPNSEREAFRPILFYAKREECRTGLTLLHCVSLAF